MINNGFKELLNSSEEFLNIIKALQNKISPLNISGVTESVTSHLAFSVAGKLERSAVIIAPDGVSARRIYEDMQFFDRNSMMYLDRELIFYDNESCYQHSAV